MKILALAVFLLALPAAAGAQRPPQVERGHDLYVANCVSCHGPNGEGVEDSGRPDGGAGGIRALGPPLSAAGAAGADFYLRTGAMPLRDPFDPPERSQPSFTNREIEALVAFVASLGKGPQIPEPHPEQGSLSEGLQLFTEKCSGCHQVLAQGGVVTGARVPPLGDASAVQIAEAVRIGPYVMPRFSERDLSDSELDSIIRYVDYAKSPEDEGGWGIGHIGPVPEGIVTWLVAAVVLLAVSIVIGKRLKS